MPSKEKRKRGHTHEKLHPKGNRDRLTGGLSFSLFMVIKTRGIYTKHATKNHQNSHILPRYIEAQTQRGGSCYPLRRLVVAQRYLYNLADSSKVLEVFLDSVLIDLIF